MFEVLALGMVSASVLGGSAAFRSRAPRRAARSLRNRLVGSEVHAGWFRRLVARGYEGGVEVAVRQLPPPTGPGLRIEGRLPDHLASISVRGGRSARERCSVCCGDLGFDGLVDVDGPELEVAACLTQPARAALLRLIRAGGEVGEGWVKVDLRGLAWCPTDIEDLLMFVARTARLLSYPEGAVAKRLRGIVADDPDPRVRATTLDRMVALIPDQAETEEAVQMGLTSSDPALRLVAACAVPARGARVARRLLESGELSPVQQVRARKLLVRTMGRSEDREALRGFAGSLTSLEAAAAAATALGEVGGPADARLLHELAGRLFTPSQVRRAASAGLARLRRRFGGDLSGALSLCSGPVEGALSPPNETVA